jgi:hypothetical protein
MLEKWFWAKSRTGRSIEGGMHLLDAALGFGLVSIAVVSAVLGKLILACLLAVFALGVLVRMARRRN